MYWNDRSRVNCRAPGRFIDWGSIGQVAEPQLARRTSAPKNAVTAKPTRAARSAAEDRERMQTPPDQKKWLRPIREGAEGGVRPGAGVPRGGRSRPGPGAARDRREGAKGRGEA